jgi:A/G-specific adenine glycosylase
MNKSSFEGIDLIKDYLSGKCHSFSDEEISFTRKNLVEWYHANRRSLPWRGDKIEGFPFTPSPSPYGTWVSEIMLQQTRVETVIKYWFDWMNTYPSIKDLSESSVEEVNRLWAGLGYYSRAQRLREGAIKIIQDFDGELPDTVSKLLLIPGIGPYTAGAIASIAFGKVEVYLLINLI